MSRTVVVVGGGIAGLAAAHRLLERAPHLRVVVVEQAERPGGKLRTVELAGGRVERGAESFLFGDPAGGPSAAVRLAAQLGLDDTIVHPAVAKAAVAFDGGLHDLPAGTLMGIPVAADGPEPVESSPLLRPGQDLSVGELVRPRRGDLVVDRYVEPLLGGVYAGRADRLSLRMALPALAQAAEQAHTLSEAVRLTLAARRRAPVAAEHDAARSASTAHPGTSRSTAQEAARAGTPQAPVFGTFRGGMSTLVDALVAGLPEVRLGLPVRALRRRGSGWQLTVGSTREPSTVDADAVVLAVPAAPAARLLSTSDGVPAVPLEYASVALVALALPATKLPELSGFLVPATEGFAVKAVTFFDRKWAHLQRPGLTVLRASVGRAGEEHQLQRTDAALVELVREEVARLVGVDRLPDPVGAEVFRWGGGLPQYAPGHRDRVAALREALPPGIAVAGAAYDGVGVPACITSGWAAADTVLEELEG